MPPKVLVVGGTGLVGNALVRAWKSQGAEVAAATYHCHPSGGFLQLDIRDEKRVRELLARHRPEVVAVPAANPYVDYCELHPEETRGVNVAGTGIVARACAQAGARMIFFSTDYVFDGKTGGYREEDPPSPLSEYGRQKVEGERLVLSASPRNLVVRTAGAYGWQWEPKNFILQLVSKLKARQPLRVAQDLKYNPTYVESLAEIVVALTAGGHSGLFHVAGGEVASRYEFAVRAAKAFGLDASLISPALLSDFHAPAARPRFSALDVSKVRASVEPQPFTIDQGLRHMLGLEAQWREYAKTLPDPAAKTLPA